MPSDYARLEVLSRETKEKYSFDRSPRTPKTLVTSSIDCSLTWQKNSSIIRVVH